MLARNSKIQTNGWVRNHGLRKRLQDMSVWKVGPVDDRVDEAFGDKIIGGFLEIFENVPDEDLSFPPSEKFHNDDNQQIYNR